MEVSSWECQLPMVDFPATMFHYQRAFPLTSRVVCCWKPPMNHSRIPWIPIIIAINHQPIQNHHEIPWFSHSTIGNWCRISQPSTATLFLFHVFHDFPMVFMGNSWDFPGIHRPFPEKNGTPGLVPLGLGAARPRRRGNAAADAQRHPAIGGDQCLWEGAG